jgi:hypothetical protein
VPLAGLTRLCEESFEVGFGVALHQQKRAHGALQAQGLLLKQAGRTRGFCYLRGVLLGDGIHFRDSIFDLIDAVALLGRGGRNIAHDLSHVPDRGHDLRHRLTRLFHQRGAVVDQFQAADAGEGQVFGDLEGGARGDKEEG